jgi:hypothetical protein
MYTSSTDYEICVLYKATFQPIRLSYPYHSPLALPLLALRLGCATFTTFFICFEANLIEYESYTLPIRMFVYIRIVRFLFASSHRFAYKYLIMQKNTCCSESLLQSKYSLNMFPYWQIFGSKYSQTLCKFHF